MRGRNRKGVLPRHAYAWFPGDIYVKEKPVKALLDAVRRQFTTGTSPCAGLAEQ